MAGDLYWTSIIAARDFDISKEVLSHSNLIRREINLGWEPLKFLMLKLEGFQKK